MDDGMVETSDNLVQSYVVDSPTWAPLSFVGSGLGAGTGGLQLENTTARLVHDAGETVQKLAFLPVCEDNERVIDDYFAKSRPKTTGELL